MERLKELRKIRGLTQAELGKLVGVSTVTIGNWEKGIRKPKLETLEKLEQALGKPGSLTNRQQEDKDEILNVIETLRVAGVSDSTILDTVIEILKKSHPLARTANRDHSIFNN